MVFKKVSEYYFRYGENTAGCADDFEGRNQKKNKKKQKIRKVAVYYPIMNRGGVQRVISLLFPIYNSIQCETILITEKISDEDYYVPEWVKRFVITDEGHALSDRNDFIKRYKELQSILESEQVDLFLHHGVRHDLFVYDIILANLMGIYTAAVKHQVFTQGFCDINDLFWTHLPIFKILDGLVVLSKLEETYWKTFGIRSFYIENPFNEELKDKNIEGVKDSVTWVGRLDIYSKQYFDVVETAAIVKESYPDVKFKMFGSGNQAKICELNQYIKRNGLEKNVHFCGYETDIASIYKNTRIQLVTSAYECFPMVIYESKILGIPLVMYELPYLELLKNKLGYRAVPNGDIQGLAKNICRVLDSPKLEKQLSNEARVSIQGFNNEQVGQKWAHFFYNIEEQIYDNSEKNDDYGMIIRTMHKHYAIAQKKYEKLAWDSEQSVLLFHIKNKIRDGKELVICPFGKIGKRAKKMLNEKGIQEVCIVDNGLAEKYSDILSLDELYKMDCSNYVFLICCEDGKLQDFFYNHLKEKTQENNIIYYNAPLE